MGAERCTAGGSSSALSPGCWVHDFLSWAYHRGIYFSSTAHGSKSGAIYYEHGTPHLPLTLATRKPVYPCAVILGDVGDVLANWTPQLLRGGFPKLARLQTLARPVLYSDQSQNSRSVANLNQLTSP